MQTWIEPLGWMLVHSVWLISLVAGIAAIVLGVLRHAPANVRYVVGCIAMLVSLATMPISLVWLLTHSVKPQEMVMVDAERLKADTEEKISINAEPDFPTQSVLQDLPLPQTPVERTAIVGETASQDVTQTPAPVVKLLLSERIQARLRPHLALLVTGWLAGVCLLSLRPLIGWQTSRRLRQVGLSEVPASVSTALFRLTERLKLHRAVAIFQSSLIRVPCVLGAFKPVILLPASVITGLSVEQLEAVLAHELAHVRRCDFVVNALQTMAEALLFYHPALWWLSRRVREEREHCCDDLAVTLCNPAEYCRALMVIEQLRGRGTVLALGVNDGSLLARVRRIASFRSPALQSQRTEQIFAGVVAVMTLALTIALTLVLAFPIAFAAFREVATPDPTHTNVVIEWTALVDQSVLDEIRRMNGVASHAPQRGEFETIRCSADQLRAVLRSHVGRPMEVSLSESLSVLPPSYGAYRPSPLVDQPRSHHDLLRYGVDDCATNRPFSFRLDFEGTCFIKDNDPEVGLRISYPDFKFSLLGGESVTHPVRIDTTLKPDEAIINVIFPGQGNPALLLVHETQRIPKELEVTHSHLLRLDDWVSTGRDGKLDQAARIVDWRKRPQHSLSEVDTKWTREVAEHRGKIELIALSRPNLAPDIAWTPNGLPTEAYRSLGGVSGFRDDDLIAWFRIWDPADTNRGHLLVQESAKSPEAIGAQFQMVILPPTVDRDRKLIKVGAGFGPWTAEITLELREDAIATLEGSQYRLRGLQAHETKERESSSVSVLLEPTPNRPEIELWLVAATKSGKFVEPAILTEHGVGINNEINIGGGYWFALPQSEIDHFVLKSRPIQWTEFTNFAIEPAEPLNPPLDFANKQVEMNTQADASGIRPDKYIAELPDWAFQLPGGIEGELVGVGMHPSADEPFWRPDGSQLEKQPTEKCAGTVMPGSPEQKRCRELFFNIRGLPNESVVQTKFHQSSAGGGALKNGVWAASYAVGPFPDTSASFRLLICSKPAAGRCVISNAGEKNEGNSVPEEWCPFWHLVKPLRTQETNGKAELILDGALARELEQVAELEMRARDETDKSHAYIRTGSSPDTKSFGFDLPLSAVKAFVFRIRPFTHQVTFENVALQPGQKTDLKVKVEPLPPMLVTAPDVILAQNNPLERKVSLVADEMPLKVALQKVAAAAGLELEFDVEALKQAELDLDEPVSVKLDNVPLANALGRLINWSTHPGIWQEIRRGKLVFTTLEVWQARTAARLPEWMKPHYSKGLSANLNDSNEIVSVTMSGTVTDELLAQIATLPQLKELHIEVTKGVTPAGIAHLAEMPRLEKLTLYNVNTEGAGLGDDAIRSLVGAKSLRELSIGECGTTDAGAKLLEQLPQLTSLSLNQDGQLTDEALKSIGKLTRLKSLSLNSYVGTEKFGWMRFSAAGIRQLRELKELQSLHLVGQEVPADALVFPKLTSLSLGHRSVDDAVATKIGELRELHQLELMYCGISSDGLKPIAALPELRQLTISSDLLSDEGVEHFREHKWLEHISLRANGLTDESLTHLAQIETLTRIDLYGSGQPGVSPGDNFSIAGLQQLKTLPKLETLWLTNLNAPGAGYLGLKELKQLREITMMMCNVTDAELESLEEALPDTRITHMTGGGGRIPKQIRKMPKAAVEHRAEETGKPKGKEAQSLFKKWQEHARTDGKIPGALIGHVTREIDNFVKRYPQDENAPKLAALRSQLDSSHDWTQADVAKLFDDITAISTAPISWADLPMEFSTMNNQKLGTPLPDELKDVAWGPPAANGLRAAWLLEPRAEQYALGSVLKARVLFHNSGQTPVVFKTETWHQGDSHTARDANAGEIEIKDTWYTGDTPMVTFRLAPGEYCEVSGRGIAIGAGKYVEEFSIGSVGAIIEAKEGDEVRFASTVDVSHGGWTRPDDPKDPVELWKKIIGDRVESEAPLPSTAADREQLIRRVTLDIFGEPATAEEIETFIADTEPNALAKLTSRLQAKPRIEPFAGNLPTGETTFRVIAADPNATSEPRTGNAPGRYVLSENVHLLVSRITTSAKHTNKATIAFLSPDPTVASPHKPHEIALPDDLDSYAFAWERDSGELWLLKENAVYLFRFGADGLKEEGRYDLWPPTVLTRPLKRALLRASGQRKPDDEPPLGDEALETPDTARNAKTLRVLKPATEAKLPWGSSVNGLRAALVMMPPNEALSAGDVIDQNIIVQNVSANPIRIRGGSPVPFAALKANDANGADVAIERSIVDILSTIEEFTLQPREIAVMSLLSTGIGKYDANARSRRNRSIGQWIAAGRGPFHFTCVLTFQNAGNEFWQGPLLCGKLTVQLTSNEAQSPSDTGSPKQPPTIPGAGSEQLRVNGQAAFVRAEYPAMERLYLSLVTQEIATPEDAMWLGHAQHLQGRVKDAAASYLLMLTLADQRIVMLQKQTEPTLEQLPSDNEREFGGPVRDWKQERDRELERFAELWPQWVLLAGQVQLRDVGDAAGAAKALARGLRFVPEAESMEALLKDAQQSVATKPQPISEQTRWRTWLYPMATQRSLAMAYEQLGDHAAAARCWCRFQLSWLAYQVGMANAKAAVIEAAIAKVPNDQREPFHEFVLKHPGRKKAGTREFDIPQRLKTDPQNPFEIRSRLDGFEMMNNGPSQPSVTKLKNGSWLMAFTSGDPFQARVMFARSDDGKIWSKPYDFAHNGIFPTRSPSVIEDDDGTLWLLCSSQRLDPNRYSSGGYQWWLCASKDGRTWSTLMPLTFIDGRPFGGSYQHTAQLTRDSNGKFWIFSNEFAGSTDRLSELPRMQPLVLGLAKDEHITSSFATFDADNRCHLALTTLTELSLTSSSNMQSWQPRQVLLRREPNRGLDHPRLLVDGDRFVLFYQAGWGQFRSGRIEPSPDGGAAKISLSKPVSLDLEVSGSLITQDGDDVLLIANLGYENSPPVLLSAKRSALLAMADHKNLSVQADAAATKNTDSQVNEADRETLRRLVRGGKIDGNSLQAMIARVAESGAKDVEFARLVLVEFERSCAADPGATRLNRDLLAVMAEMFESWGATRWRTQLDRLAANDQPATKTPQPEAIGQFEAEMLKRLIRHAYNADRSNIAAFTLAARQLHHPESRNFLRDVLRNPENNDIYAPADLFAPANGTKPTPSPLPETQQKPGAVIKSKWKDSIGGGWGDAKFIAAVGLAELNDAEGVEWLLSMARDNDFGIDGSLWEHRHVRDPRGSLRVSSRLALADLFRLRTEPSFEQLTNRWRELKPQFIARQVALMLSVNRPQQVVGEDDAATPESTQPNGKEAQSLFKKWQSGARANGHIPGGTLGPLVRMMTTFVKNNPTHEGAPKFVELLKRIDVKRDWSHEEAVELLDEVTAIYPSLPEWVEGEKRFSLGGDVVTGKLLPDELKDAPWGEAQPNGLRVAWLLEPRGAEHRLNTPLKSRLLFHNSGKNAVVFRALTWNQSGGHQARDAQGAKININSTDWTTIPRVFACRLAPGEFIEVVAAGIGVGANKDQEDWRETRVGSWIEAKVGDDVTFQPDAVDCAVRDAPQPETDGAQPAPENWWLTFIKNRLSLDAPLPADAAERGRLLDRAMHDLFGNAPTDDELAAFKDDATPEALDALAKRLAERSGFELFSGSLTSGPTKFKVLPVDPDAAKKPRTARNPGQYKLGGNATFVVTRRGIGERTVNEARLTFSPTDATKPAPREPHEIKLPDGYDTWSAAWMRGGTMLWVEQKGTVSSYDFSNPAQVQETQFAEADFNKVPEAIQEALGIALDGPGTPKKVQEPLKNEGENNVRDGAALSPSRDVPKALNGLQTRMTLLTERPAIGQPLKVKIELQNVGTVARTYSSQRANPDYLLDVVGPDGKLAEFINGGAGIPVQTLKIKPGETVALWDEVDVASMFLLSTPGQYEIKLRGTDKFEVDETKPEQAHPYPTSNTLAVTLSDGTLNDIQATFVRIRNVAPKD